MVWCFQKRQALQHSSEQVRQQLHSLSSELLGVQAEWAAQRECIDSELETHKHTLAAALRAAEAERASLDEARRQVARIRGWGTVRRANIKGLFPHAHTHTEADT